MTGKRVDARRESARAELLLLRRLHDFWQLKISIGRFLAAAAAAVATIAKGPAFCFLNYRRLRCRRRRRRRFLNVGRRDAHRARE